MATDLNVSSTADNANTRRTIQLTDQTNLLPLRQLVACFLGLALCIVVSTLDSVVVATALPTISTAFNAGAIVSWVPSAYLLTSTTFQPLYGRMSDIFGRKAAIATAMIIFLLGNLAAGFSRTIIQLIVFRGIAGAGGGGIISMAQIIISDIVSLRDRGKYQGIIGVVITVGFAIGPLIGGALAEKVSWRWCFWINIPTSLAAILTIIFLLPLKQVSADIKSQVLAIDFVGALLSLVGCTLVLLPLIWGGVTFPWSSPIILATLFTGFTTTVVFCLWEWKGAKLPIVPMYIFRHITVSGVYLAMFVNGFFYFSTLFYLPQYLQVVLRYDPIQAGVFLIPMLVSQMVASAIAGILVSRTGRYRATIYSGFAICSLSCGLISTITAQSSKAVLVIYMLLAGVGSGQALQTTTVAAQASVARKDMSVVTAFRNFIRLLGGTLALAVDSTVLNNTLQSSMVALSLPSKIIKAIISGPAVLANPSIIHISTTQSVYIMKHGYNAGFRVIFIINAALTAAATITSIWMIKHQDLNREDDKLPSVHPAPADSSPASALEKQSSK